MFRQRRHYEAQNLPLLRLSGSVLQREFCRLVTHWAHIIAQSVLDLPRRAFQRSDPRPVVDTATVCRDWPDVANCLLGQFVCTISILYPGSLPKANCCGSESALPAASQRVTADIYLLHLRTASIPVLGASGSHEHNVTRSWPTNSVSMTTSLTLLRLAAEAIGR